MSRPTPRISELSRPHWDAARAGRLVLQRCTACSAFRFPIAPVCFECLSDGTEWAEVSGRGVVSSWVVFHRVFLQGFADRVPYNVALVELAEGPRLTTNILECRNEDLYVGMPVVVTFEALPGGCSLPQFRPARLAQGGEAA